MPFNVFTYQLMSTHKNIYLSISKVSKNLFCFFGRTSTRKIVNTNRKILQAVSESLIMLKSKNGCWYKNRCLLTIASTFKSSTNSYLSLSKAHITTHKSVHRLSHLHIMLHFLCSLWLIRCIFIKETCLQLLLHISIGTKCKTFLFSTSGIQLNKVSCNILDAFLGFLFQTIPSSCTKSTQTRSLASITTTILTYLIQRMNRYINLIIILINDTYHFLIALLSLRITFLSRNTNKSSELTNTKINMNDEISRFHLLQLLHSKCHFSWTGNITAKIIFMETIKYLVVSKEAGMKVIINKAFMNGTFYRLKLNRILLQLITCKNLFQTLILFLTISKNKQLVSFENIIL